MRFALSRTSHDTTVTLGVAGEVDLGTSGLLRAAIQDALGTPHAAGVTVDLDGVTFLDCTGIGALVAGHNTAVRLRRRYLVTNPQRPVRRILEVTGVLPVLSHSPDPAPRTGRPGQPPRPATASTPGAFVGSTRLSLAETALAPAHRRGTARHVPGLR
ncbi:STAS domain-containing protein [Plantactinospora veratri]|uniref:Anti-sigma factor antagonist n=1 Tax=Plantactinospora veratri TaxID=1436122 RepID=A0ABU7SH60_9ACTN